MANDRSWLDSRNSERAANRAAARARALSEGKLTRLPNDGLGQQRAHAKYVQKRAAQRRLAKARRARRPFVQGRRRLWGKGPAPLYYIQRASSDSGSPLAPAEIAPLSHVACCGSPLAPAGITPSLPASSHWEPLDTPILDMLGHHLNEHGQRLQGMREQGEFRALALYAGVRM